MSGALAAALLLAASAAPQGKAPEGAGTVWLAGAEATLPASERAAVLLVAAAPDSPAPLDARPWGGGADSAVIDVRPESGELDAATLERVRRARRLLLGPGDLAQWRAALWDEPRPRPLALALREAWAGGAEVAARGAGALVLGVAYLDRESELERRNPRAGDASVSRAGLGLLGAPLLDGAARGVDLRALAGRLIAPGTSRALWIPAAGGLCCEPGAESWTGFGTGAVLHFDARAARRTGQRVEGVLVEWIDAGRSGGARDPLRAGAGAAPAERALEEVEDAWAPEHWQRAPDPGAQRAWRSPGASVHLRGLPAVEGAAAAARLALECRP